MRTFIGVMLLLIVIGGLALTCFYQVNTNSTIQFSLRNPEEPVTRTRVFPVRALKQGDIVPSADPYAIPDTVMQVTPPTPAEQPTGQPNTPATLPNDGIPVAEPVEE